MNVHESLKAAVTAANLEYVRRNVRSREIASEAARWLPGGNTRSSLWYFPFPLCMVHGWGCRLRDADGHEYVDFLGEFTAGIFGHSPQPVKDAVAGALEDGINLSAHNRWEAKLAGLLCGRFPSMELVRFTNSGTEANLMALAAAKVVTGRRKILVFDRAYHGSLLNFLPGGEASLVPHEFIRGPYNDVEGTRALIEEHRHDLAAVLVEPMLGSGGCLPGTPEFLCFLRDEAANSGALLIFDEIQTSRLSVGGRQKLLDIKPDLTTLGKYFGGGLPFGCFGGRRDVMKLFDPREPGAISLAGTFNNNTLTLAAGTAAVPLLTAAALELLNRRGDRLREALLSLFKRAAVPFTVTGMGSLMSIHPTGPPDAAAWLRTLLFLDLAASGMYLAARGLIALSLAIGDDEVSQLLATLESIFEKRTALYASLE